MRRPEIVAHQRFPMLRTLPVFAVGERSAAGDARRRLRRRDFGRRRRRRSRAASRGAPARRSGFLYLAGAERAGDLAGDLAARGFAVDTAVVYRAVAATDLAPDAVRGDRRTASTACCISRAAARRLMSRPPAPRGLRCRGAGKARPFLSVRAGGGAARASRRVRHPHRAAADRGRADRAYSPA